TAEIQYWDEGNSMLDVASLALRLWNEYRSGAQLPKWEVVGLEVVSREVWLARDGSGQPSQAQRPAQAPGSM
ncbi:MAG TPA: hypothetical protein PKX56_03405, partial [Marmoricola sp.]|nr:hypothetical protein [Marmoricola sp.]